MSKTKNAIARVGNFEIVKDSSAEHDYIRIRAINGHWSVSYRDDSPMYGIWLMMIKDPEYTKGMEVLITMSYTLANSILDEGFIRDFFTAHDAMNKRRVDKSPVPTEAEEDEALAEAEIAVDLKSDGE